MSRILEKWRCSK